MSNEATGIDDNGVKDLAKRAKSPRYSTISVLVVVLLGTVITAVAMSITSLGGGKTATPGVADARPDAGRTVVATVNGQAIYEAEIIPLMGQMAKAVAIDGYINKVLAAQAGKANTKWGDEAAGRVQAAEREVLSAMYFEKSSAEINAGITEADIQTYYDRNISDEMFNEYGASYVIYADMDSATNGAKSLASVDQGETKNLKKFQTQDGKDAMFAAGQFPYDMGRVIEGMKVGDVSQPLATRNGYFVIKLDKKNAGKKPELKIVKAKVIQTIASQRLSTNVAKLRSSAKIELR
jgi:hypothetical protein